MLGCCDRMGRASPWLPAPLNLPKEVATQAPFCFPDTEKEPRQERKGFYIPLGLRLLLNSPTRSPSQAWVTQLLDRAWLMGQLPGVLCVTIAMRLWLAALHMPLPHELKLATQVCCSEIGQQLAF